MQMRLSRSVAFGILLLVLAGSGGFVSADTPGGFYRVEEQSIAQLEADLAAGKVSSEDLVRAYLARIEAMDARGPALHSVIAINPHAIADAREADARRRSGNARLLEGIPILIKDNIESNDPTATTAGSEALALNVTQRDAPLVRRLKDAGAIVLGKTNLSEWANIRSSHSISGWSAIGGLVKNPYSLDRNACGSSSGTGAAVAASFAAAGVGTETDGSIVCPSSLAGLVGLKPTVGLVSRTHVVPISHSQDTPGPRARSVADAAALLTAMAGSDPADPATAEADRHKTDYRRAIEGASVRGKRIGVLRFATGNLPAVDVLFESALAVLRDQGAVLVEIKDYKPDPTLSDSELVVLLTELKADLNAYLATAAPAVSTRTLADVIAFNRAHPRELALFGQELFEQAEATKGLADPAYLEARRTTLKTAAADGIDKLIDANQLDALVAPSDGPAWRTDVVTGDHPSGGADQLPAIAGYPHLTVPMGDVRGLPVGISFIGKAWSEAQLLALGAAYEHATRHRKAPRYIPSIESESGVLRAFAPSRGS
jgi:amidase